MHFISDTLPYSVPMLLTTGIFYVLACFLMLFVSAIILRESVSICNRTNDNEDSVDAIPKLSSIKAIVVFSLSWGITSALSFIPGYIFYGMALSADFAEDDARVIAFSCTLPFSFFIMSGMLSVLLQTKFWNAMLVNFYQILITSALVGLLVAGYYAIKSFL